jgi:hypothetical protein
LNFFSSSIILTQMSPVVHPVGNIFFLSHPQTCQIIRERTVNELWIMRTTLTFQSCWLIYLGVVAGDSQRFAGF